ncbi:MBL fold metallo-hydrolase [Beggiatoa leptomitoformis]|uniref:MBL fold metallo-hydrolase n=1 Tax=Beggiatoa leptomitoformis TaxID=288004 RepID=A0A2N9YFP3_9GAMM|nr:MBL fold metallo-hydrolase [Beggiatoa leptomitoformis]ALG68314.1 MBL fold metallo-hydrolase [Beggiatoa leptomitoformis]AUI69371.1 MBL fold metallo-hydrolase [Beggiatoa leptomitoformis]
MPVELYNDGTHKCIAFYDLVSGEGVQANQFLIVNGSHSALIDPGGDLIYNDLFMKSYKYVFTKNLEYVIGSHQDPDIISSLNKWLVGSECKVIVPGIWERFIPHFAPPGKSKDRIIGIPDKGMDIYLGNTILKAIPAHFLHSEGNFQFYDPLSKILFSGDLGASMVHSKEDQPVDDFEAHIKYMKPFHQRYMSSNKVCRYWVNMIKELDIEWIVPQHGRSFKGKEMIAQFLAWIETLECGVDLVTQDFYKIP